MEQIKQELADLRLKVTHPDVLRAAVDNETSDTTVYRYLKGKIARIDMPLAQGIRKTLLSCIKKREQEQLATLNNA